MKSFRPFVLALISLLLFSCASKDDISKIYGEIDALKVQIGQINTNISSMQTVLNASQNQDYVTSVAPIMRDGTEIGYTINFQKSGPVTIYHGKDGAAGMDKTPAIGVRQYTDSKWYWTLDGEWLKDDAGNMICANGVSPQLKIENGYWSISYDEGTKWTQLGKATGEDGAPGDSFFKAVDVSNDQYVNLTLADGSEIRLQKYAGIGIELSQQDNIEIQAAQTIGITYRITAMSDNPKLAVIQQDGYTATVKRTSGTEGILTVTAPAPFNEGCISVVVTDDSQVKMETLSFISPAMIEGDLADKVDLGLSVKWASFNVGASKPEEYGNYYAWGDIEPYYSAGNYQKYGPGIWETGKEAGYEWASYKWCDGTYSSLTKYCTDASYGTVDNRTVLKSADDVARQEWGGKWRMPTQAECEELRTNCTWTWTTLNGVKGYRVTSNKAGYTNKSIFLPAAGSRYDTSVNNVGAYGDYWTSSLYNGYSSYAVNLYFYSGYIGTNGYNRCSGQSIRPVSE